MRNPTNRMPRSTTRLTWLLALAATVLWLAPRWAAAQDAGQPATNLQTATYGLYPVGDSGVRAQLQVTSTLSGGVRLILSATGIEAGNVYSAAIYRGDCGPDRPLALTLVPIGTAPNDPYVSTTDATDLSFEQLTTGDYFVYLFSRHQIDTPDSFGLDVPALACGEVGAGANR